MPMKPSKTFGARHRTMLPFDCISRDWFSWRSRFIISRLGISRALAPSWSARYAISTVRRSPSRSWIWSACGRNSVRGASVWRRICQRQNGLILSYRSCCFGTQTNPMSDWWWRYRGFVFAGRRWSMVGSRSADHERLTITDYRRFLLTSSPGASTLRTIGVFSLYLRWLTVPSLSCARITNVGSVPSFSKSSCATVTGKTPGTRSR